MRGNNSYLIGGATCCVVVMCSCLGGTATSVWADEMEVLKVTVGQPTKLSDVGYTNSASLAISRTGVVAAFYKTGHPLVWKVSKDGGRTWGEEVVAPQAMLPNANCIGLRDGGVIKNIGLSMVLYPGLPLAGAMVRFSDDFENYKLYLVEIHLPETQLTHQEGGLYSKGGPIFDKGKMIQLSNGDVLAPMFGRLDGDTNSRILISRSSDQGRTWHYYATIAYEPEDSNPELPGGYMGFAEPSITLLPNGQMLCVARTQGSQLPSQYRPLYACWSDDLGKTWTKPVPTRPALHTIWPTLQVLDNGVLACIYGRPGFHMAFSTDNGHTWKDRVSFTDIPEPDVTGQVDGLKVGANKLLAIGGVGPGGTQLFPVTVERVKVATDRVVLIGSVLDQQGRPIVGAVVQRSPNRYAAEFWQESTELDPWKVGPRHMGSPRLGYRSIRRQLNDPTVETDAKGQFRFEDVPLGEWILTVETNGYMPQWRRHNVGPGPESQSVEFSLQLGQIVRGRIIDNFGDPVSGASVILNKWHVYSGVDGYFDHPIKGPLPQQVHLKIHKRYHNEYQFRKMTIPPAELEENPVIVNKYIHLMKFRLWDVIPGREDEFLRQMLEKSTIDQVKSYMVGLQSREDKLEDVKRRASEFEKQILWFKSLGHEEALTYIKESQEQKNVNILCVSLFALGTEALQATAADSLGNLVDTTAVPCLANRLRQATAVVFGQKKKIRRHLRQSLIRALTTITGIKKVPAGADPTFSPIDKLLDDVEIWINQSKS